MSRVETRTPVSGSGLLVRAGRGQSHAVLSSRYIRARPPRPSISAALCAHVHSIVLFDSQAAPAHASRSSARSMRVTALRCTRMQFVIPRSSLSVHSHCVRRKRSRVHASLWHTGCDAATTHSMKIHIQIHQMSKPTRPSACFFSNARISATRVLVFSI